MKQILILGGLAAAGLAFVPLTTSGPYLDSHGRVWNQLPRLSDYSSAAEFDALFAHEVFTTRDGHRFQIDRPWTPEEAAANAGGSIHRDPGQVPGGSIRAVVNLTHPVDEEYRSSFNNNIPNIRSHVIGVINSADSAMKANWGIDLVPKKGYKWDSRDNADIAQLLDEAYTEGHGLNGQDMMIAFSNDPTPGGAIGIAYIGLPRALIKKYGNSEANITEHEVGHTYTLQHCCDGNCTMQAYLDIGAFHGFHNYQESCSGQNHYRTMNNQRNRY
ncbi:MAG: hypothetical protein D6702_02250 [Planctomycetota bacterium]|nr:MAG: hypothetical protein D6702_02250 [Planctomycetota bacterium]